MMIFAPCKNGLTCRLLQMAAYGLLVGCAFAVGAIATGPFVFQLVVPSVGEQTIVAVPQAKVGSGLAFRLEGDQRPGCVLNQARWLYYRDTHAIVPLTDANLPNVAVAYSEEGTADQTHDSQWVKAHFVLPLPASYVPAGTARLEIQADDAPCGYYHGVLPTRVLHWRSDWIDIQPALEGK